MSEPSTHPLPNSGRAAQRGAAPFPPLGEPQLERGSSAKTEKLQNLERLILHLLGTERPKPPQGWSSSLLTSKHLHNIPKALDHIPKMEKAL